MTAPLIPPRPDLADGYYTQIYADIVQPNRIWSVSKYFLRRWTRYFAAHHHFWAVVAARQLAYLNQNRPWCNAHDTVLADGSGLNVDHFRRQIKHQLGQEPREAIDLFITRGHTPYVREGDVTRPGPTRYQVRLDDPLVPADVDYLRTWLSNATADYPQTPAGITALLRQALQLPATELRAPKLPLPGDAAPRRFQALTAADVVAELFADAASDPDVQETAEALHTHITRPLQIHIGTHYFRERWLPLLGPGPAFLLTFLRSQCYYNEKTGELRDEVQVTLPELAATLGISRNTLPRWLKKIAAAVPDQIWGTFFQERRRERAGNTTYFTYGINLNEPLLAGDLHTYQQRLREAPAADPKRSPDPAAPKSRSHSSRGTTKKSVTAPAPEPQNVAHTATSATPESRSHTPTRSPEKSVTPPAVTPHSRPHPPSEPQKVGAAAPKSRSIKTYKDLLTTVLKIETRTLEVGWPQLQPGAESWFGQELAFVVAANWPQLFETLDIQGQAQQQLTESGLVPADGVAWYLFAVDQAWTTHPVGYVIQRMAAGEAPPERYRQFAALSLGAWHIFAVAAERREQLPDALWRRISADPLFNPWQQVYGTTPLERLPFDVGRGVQGVLDHFARSAMPGDGVGENRPVPPAADQAIWDEVLTELELQMTRATFDSCLRHARLVDRRGDAFTIAVAGRSALAWVERRLRPVVERTVSALAEVEQPQITFVNAEEESET